MSTTSCSPSALASPLHELLSSLSSPSSTLLSIIWICPHPPAEMEPSLYGALQRCGNCRKVSYPIWTIVCLNINTFLVCRAVSWHKASLLLFSQSQDVPPWLEELGAQVISLHIMIRSSIKESCFRWYHWVTFAPAMVSPATSLSAFSGRAILPSTMRCSTV